MNPLTKELLNDLADVLEKHGASFEVIWEDHGKIHLDLDIDGKWDEDGNLIREYENFNLGMYIAPEDLRKLANDS